MMLAEFYGWLSLESGGRYHHSVPRILGTKGKGRATRGSMALPHQPPAGYSASPAAQRLLRAQLTLIAAIATHDAMR